MYWNIKMLQLGNSSATETGYGEENTRNSFAFLDSLLLWLFLDISSFKNIEIWQERVILGLHWCDITKYNINSLNSNINKDSNFT